MKTAPQTKIVAAPAPVQRSGLPDVMGLGGAIAGLIAGLAMVIVSAITALIIGGSVWIEVKAIAAPFFGPTVMRPGFEAGPVLVGTFFHFAMSALLGAIYSITTRRILKLPSDVGVPVLAGLIYGFFIWAMAYFIILPVTNPFLRGAYAPAFIMQHLVYGVVLGLVYAMLRPNPYSLTASRRLE